MSKLVLYRKYRPQRFGEIIGQEHVVQTLSNAIGSNLISHAYILSGPRGSGKTTIARLLAKAANCRDRKEGEFEPCGKCGSCLEIQEGRSMDLIEIDAASHRGIDEIRELRDGIKFAPTKEKYKVFVIDECHQLTKEAVNALLKTLEEPPSHAIFIMATTEIHKMIPTIISRCQRFDFRKLTFNEIVKRLVIVAGKEKAKIEKSALELIALNAGGALRDAESLLDQVLTFSGEMGDKEIKVGDIKELLGLTDITMISQFVDFISDKNTEASIKFLGQTFERGYDPQEFVKSSIGYLRQAMLLKIDPSAINTIVVGLTKEEREKIQIQAGKFTNQELHNVLNLFMEAENKMKYSSITELPLELAVVDFLTKTA